MQRKMALDHCYTAQLFSALVPLETVTPPPCPAPVPLFDDRRAEILHVHLPASYQVCNFRCSYCYLPVYKARLPRGLVESLERIIERLAAVQRPMNIIFAGLSDVVTRRFKRVNSLYNFVLREPGDPCQSAFCIEEP